MDTKVKSSDFFGNLEKPAKPYINRLLKKTEGCSSTEYNCL